MARNRKLLIGKSAVPRKVITRIHPPLIINGKEYTKKAKDQ